MTSGWTRLTQAFVSLNTSWTINCAACPQYACTCKKSVNIKLAVYIAIALLQWYMCKQACKLLQCLVPSTMI